MADSMDKYLQELKREMKNSDPAIKQDALNDTREHLSTAMSEAMTENPGANESDLFKHIISEFGTPKETAESYLELENRMGGFSIGNSGIRRKPDNSKGFFSIFSDAAAWGAVLYSLLSLATGILYFTWAVTGISVSVSLLILIIGLPITAAFFLSFRGLSFIEGRLVEGLLGIRMPRRQKYYEPDSRWVQKVKALLLSKESWMTVLYFILMLPLGIFYFTITVTLFSVSVAFMASPFAAIVISLPVIDIGPVVWGIPPWTLPFVAVIGFFILKGSLHMFKGLGKLHGELAKSMIVGKND